MTASEILLCADSTKCRDCHYCRRPLAHLRKGRLQWAELDMGAEPVELCSISENIDRRVSIFWCLEGGSFIFSLGGVTVSWLSLP